MTQTPDPTAASSTHSSDRHAETSARFRRAPIFLVWFAALTATVLAAELFLAPGLLVARDLHDPAIAAPGISGRTLELHESLSRRLTPWARARIASGAATRVPLHDVPQTEWPLFTCVFFLNATESIAALGHDVAYADESIRAARDLLMDEGHHTWVRTHWGDDYLHDENVFFRSLLIAGLTSHEALTHEGTDLAFLRDQVETLARDLDASPHGVLQDYPGETYPIDVLAAIAYIRRADAVLGTDHRAFTDRALRAFVSPYDDATGLVRFRVDLDGEAMPAPVQPGRGIGNSWIALYAPELWPEEAKRWYDAHETDFWQEGSWATGFREYRRGGPEGEWTYEVDAGPVLDGFGTSASAFGLGAERRNGRFDHAHVLTGQMIAASWPELGGGLMLPREFSHPAAPLLGEAALAYFLTVQPSEGVDVVPSAGSAVTPLVGFAFFVYFGVFFGVLSVSVRAALAVRRAKHGSRWRFGIGALLFGVGLTAGLFDPFVALALVFVSLIVQRPARRSSNPEPELRGHAAAAA